MICHKCNNQKSTTTYINLKLCNRCFLELDLDVELKRVLSYYHLYETYKGYEIYYKNDARNETIIVKDGTYMKKSSSVLQAKYCIEAYVKNNDNTNFK
jgi:hypothetical protein